MEREAAESEKDLKMLLGFPDSSVGKKKKKKKNLPAMQETPVPFLGREDQRLVFLFFGRILQFQPVREMFFRYNAAFLKVITYEKISWKR